jgi:hypothetical protein
MTNPADVVIIEALQRMMETHFLNWKEGSRIWIIKTGIKVKIRADQGPAVGGLHMKSR